MCLHTIIVDPSDAGRIFIAISAAVRFRSDDAGVTWRPINRGLKSEYIPDPTAEVGHCVHRIAMHPSRRVCCSCRSTGTSCAATTPASRGARSAVTCRPTSGSRSTCTRMNRTPIYVVPIKSDSEHFPPEGKLRVYRSRTGGNEWEALTKACRKATATSTCCATPWPLTRSSPAECTSGLPADRSTARPTLAKRGAPIVRDLPAVLSVEVQTLP